MMNTDRYWALFRPGHSRHKGSEGAPV